VLSDQIPECGARARRGQLDAALLDCRAHGLEPAVTDGLMLVPTGLPHEQWNGAWFVHAPADPAAALATANARFRSWGVPFGLVVPLELDCELCSPLTIAGATWLFPLRLMERDLTALPRVPPPAGVRIRRAEGPADYLRPRYAHPDIVDFVAVADERDEGVIGAGTVVVTGDAAGVYGIAVLDRWRRRGIGAALTSTVLAAGARRGCRIAHLNPSTLGARTYRRLGFRDVPGFHIWAPPP
jgi:GNAT superfamily N-acetyltransferase